METNGQTGSLQMWLTRLTRQIKQVHRWQHYQHTHTQNVLEHTFETILLTQIVIALEQNLGKAKFDPHRVLACACNHDLGEGIIGDVAYEVKNDPRVKDYLEQIEKEKFRELFSHLGLGVASVTVAQSFEWAFTIQEERDTTEGRLFNAIEKIGYVIFALRELEAGQHQHFTKVLRNHYEGLINYSEEFTSIKILFEVYRKEIEYYLTLPH